MTEIFVIVALYILCFQSQYLPVQCQEGASDVHKYMPQTLDGLEFFQWHLPSYCCLNGMISHQLVLATMLMI